MYEIVKLDNFGRGICYVDGVITFVYNALPNEIVKIKITKKSKKYNEAIVSSYIKKSDKRIEPACEYFSICGGCDLMHISYKDELEFKENKIKDIMYKYACVEKEKIKKIISNDNLNYRNKVTFKVDNGIGFFSKKSNEVLNIDGCFLVNPKINEVLNKIKKEDLKTNEVMIRTGNNTMVSFNDKTIVYDNNYNKIDSDRIIKEIGDYKFYVSSKSFFQVNDYMVKVLYDLILNYVGESNNLLDLYCGTGTIGIYLSSIAKNVLGVEINNSAVDDAFKNKKLNNINNIDFICLDTDKFKIKDNFDTIIVDPPRSGLGKKIINDLLNSNSKKIIYVSCDPITLARDLKILSDKYNVVEITPVDMFPRTYHCESVCVLERK